MGATAGDHGEQQDGEGDGVKRAGVRDRKLFEPVLQTEGLTWVGTRRGEAGWRDWSPAPSSEQPHLVTPGSPRDTRLPSETEHPAQIWAQGMGIWGRPATAQLGSSLSTSAL